MWEAVTRVSHDLDIGTMVAEYLTSPWQEKPDWLTDIFTHNESSPVRWDCATTVLDAGTESLASEMDAAYRVYGELLAQQPLYDDDDWESDARWHRRAPCVVDEWSYRVMPETEEPANFKTAVRVLNQVRQTAMDMGYEVPSAKVMDNARQVLARVCDKDSREFYVYPMPYGGVSIDAATPPRTRVIIICGPDGTAQGLVGREMEVKSKDYDDVGDAPDSFILDALADLLV